MAKFKAGDVVERQIPGPGLCVRVTVTHITDSHYYGITLWDDGREGTFSWTIGYIDQHFQLCRQQQFKQILKELYEV